MSDHILSLSTQAEPVKTFEIDDVSYELYGLEHLSADQEAEVTAKFTRFGQIAQQLLRSTNEHQQVNLAKQLRQRRIELITKVTSVPSDVAEKLPPSAQTRLFQAIADELGQADQISVDRDGALA